MNIYLELDDFPNYDDVDSRTVMDSEGTFNEEAADFNAEPEHEDVESEE